MKTYLVIVVESFLVAPGEIKDEDVNLKTAKALGLATPSQCWGARIQMIE